MTKRSRSKLYDAGCVSTQESGEDVATRDGAAVWITDQFRVGATPARAAFIGNPSVVTRLPSVPGSEDN